MSGVGLDPGSALAAVGCCAFVDGDERATRDSRAGVLPSAAFLDDEAFSVAFEASLPLVPFGVGGPWPPEAGSSPQDGARRIPLALAMATLERSAQSAGVETESPTWGWPRTARFDAQPLGQAQVAILVRRAIGRFAGDRGSPLALAVPNGLPLIEQTIILGRLGRSVRLIWRCMAAGLYRSYLEQQRAKAIGQRLSPETKVLHVHLGLDGFEATRFSYKRSQGTAGPELLVPLRTRPRPGHAVAVANPFLGLQLCAYAHWTNSPDPDSLWTSMFAAPSPLKVAKASVVRARQPEIARDDRRSGWTSVLEAARWQRSHAEETIHAWVGEVRSLIDSSRDGRPNIMLLTGDFAHTEGAEPVDELLVRPATMIAELARELKVPVDRLDPGAVSMGAALYASRRTRQWATYLDELPPVEIVVQSSSGARWQHLLKEPHYDAGAPVEIKLDHFSLNAGERQILLPVYVHEFGDDTADVLATRVEFTQATSARTAAEVVVAVEAATGLPVVRATVGGAVNETAEVDWANDRESARTGQTKTEYLNGLPRAFPPIEERVAGDWWVKGGRYKTVTLPAPDGNEYTGEALGVRLVALFSGAEIRFAPALKGFLRLAVKRDWDSAKLRWVAPTDGAGCNGASRSLEAAAAVLNKAVLHDWNKPSLSNTAGRALAALCWRGEEWIAHLMDNCADVRQMKELHYVIAGLGSCIHIEADMGRAIHALAMRLHEKVNVAQATRKQPVGLHTLKAMGNLFAHRPEALKCVRDDLATRLAEDITQFIELTLEHGKFMQKFQSALRALVYLTRRRAYQDGFLPVDSIAFRRAVSCCAKVYIAVRLDAEGVAWASASNKLVSGYKSDLKALYVPGRAARGSAHDSTCRIIDGVDISRVRVDGTKFPNNPDKLLALLVQVVEYIEGRGTGILVIDDDEDDDSDGDGDGN